MDLTVDVALEFGLVGRPEKFHAEAGGEMRGKLYVNITNPKLPEANGMANWHELTPQVHIGTFTFNVGPVPVVISVGGMLNGMATIDHEIKASVAMGAEMRASVRYGVDWKSASGWEKVTETSIGYT
jgi:hypothetical protein